MTCALTFCISKVISLSSSSCNGYWFSTVTTLFSILGSLDILNTSDISSIASIIQVRAGFQAFHFSSHLVISCQYKAFIVFPLVSIPTMSELFIIGIFKVSCISAFILFKVFSILVSYPKSVSIVPSVACFPSANGDVLTSQ